MAGISWISRAIEHRMYLISSTDRVVAPTVVAPVGATL